MGQFEDQAVTGNDAPYDWVRVRKIGQFGLPAAVWLRSPLSMGLPKHYLNAAIYMYPTEEDARLGTNIGATGFAVGYPYSDNNDRFHYYYVTNRHVIESHSSPIVRINSEGGGYCVVPYLETDWLFHAEGDDLAVAVARPSPAADIAFISTSQFVTQEICASLEIGAGDFVYMIGRFVDHAGTERNVPVVISGIIAMEPIEKINIGTLDKPILVDGYLADMRSRLGFSGSPTYVMGAANHHAFFPTQRAFLLGVEWGDFPYRAPILSHPETTLLPPKDWYVESESGICCISPAWRLLDLLESPKLAEQRRADEDDFRARYATPKSPRPN
jgi:hypothetical protein